MGEAAIESLPSLLGLRHLPCKAHAREKVIVADCPQQPILRRYAQEWYLLAPKMTENQTIVQSLSTELTFLSYPIGNHSNTGGLALSLS